MPAPINDYEDEDDSDTRTNSGRSESHSSWLDEDGWEPLTPEERRERDRRAYEDGYRDAGEEWERSNYEERMRLRREAREAMAFPFSDELLTNVQFVRIGLAKLLKSPPP